MKNVGIALLLFGICLEALAIFGNRAPYPLVLKLTSPEYTVARDAYRTFKRVGALKEGDEGFDTVRDAYMHLTLKLPEPPFPLDEIEGVTIKGFYASTLEESNELGDTTVIAVQFSNGEMRMIGHGSVLLIANTMVEPEAALINAGLFILGCVLVYYGLRVVFLDVKDAGEDAELLDKRLAWRGAP